jgi:sulfur dioxygenase
MYFRILHDEASGAMSYLLADLEAAEAVLIDPRGGDVPVLAAMLDEHRLRLRWVLRTHEHDTPCADEARALDTLGAPLVQHRPPGADGGALVFGHEHFRVLATPGHTERCLSFLWRDRLFCGDLLAIDACPDQPRPAAPEALWASVVQRVFPMPDETLVFGAHAPQARTVSSVLEQRRFNPWFRAIGRDGFLARVRALPEMPGARAPATTPATP